VAVLLLVRLPKKGEIIKALTEDMGLIVLNSDDD
jgi:hypothetical protein